MAILRRPAPNTLATAVLLAGVALCLATMSWRLASPPAVALAATAAGLLLLVAGTAAHRQRPANRIGLLMALAGCAIFSEDLLMAHHGLLHTLGLVLVEASTPLVIHAVLAFPRGRLESLPARILVIAAYVTTFGGSAAQALFDGSAPIDLEYNRLLWQDDLPTHLALDRGQALATGLLALAVGAIAVHRAIRAQRGDRPIMVLLASGAAAGTALNTLVELAPTVSPAKVTFLIVFYAVIMAFSIGLLVFLDRFADGLATITHLARNIVSGQSLATTEALVRRSLHDPVLRLGIFDEASGVHLDNRGAVLPPAHPPAVAREDYGLVAATYWDNGFVPPSLVAAALAVVDAARAADRAAVEAQTLLRRNLHDGAQQRLTALALRLHMLETGTIVGAPTTWAQTRQEVELASAELRRLARGEAPEGLDEGLVAALHGLAARSPIPVELSLQVTDQLPDDTAATAYFVVAEGVTNAIRHGAATVVRIRLDTAGTTLRVEVTDDGIGGARIAPGGGLAGLTDRVTRMGGTLSVSEASPTRLLVRLPLMETHARSAGR
ncbi:ATP-binding protein [Ammonicoccus fulvus]|uniref:histidine kinase n=1 Tax=Ammonicoccus fulvus TaxID=3138240 RepID=A0ABZ3FPK1_9ACTN